MREIERNTVLIGSIRVANRLPLQCRRTMGTISKPVAADLTAARYAFKNFRGGSDRVLGIGLLFSLRVLVNSTKQYNDGHG